ncbi:copper homeostasis membrane protein CopD [Sodalis sp. dw_96]|uniref:copper homeostasis membrane protein CopD n=1 Tax=Sodalis sp. dw_96 TaxID=2719794 RepID=UPI001BD39B2C|nr:copper homeostasis membrane protein CopD [Sodalis sp. dw_96]
MLTLAACFSAGRFIHVASVMQLFGIALFSEYLAPPGLRQRLRSAFTRTVRRLGWLCLLTAAVILALQSGQMGQGWPDTLRPSVWLAVIHTDFGTVWIWHLSITLATVLIIGRSDLSPWRQRLLLVAASALLVTLALTGHSAMSQGLRGVLQRINQVIHLFSAAWWLGSLIPLIWCLPLLRQAARADAMRALIHFSQSAHGAVALVILTGIINSCLIVGQWPLDFSSLYQRMLMIKITVVVIMVLLAVTNRYRVVPMMTRHHPQAIRYLTMLTLAELVLGNVVLILVSIFATLEP